MLFGYGMVLSNGCGSRALVLLGRGNLRSFVVVIVLGIAAQMTLKGLIAPARIAMLQVSQIARRRSFRCRRCCRRSVSARIIRADAGGLRDSGA
jgi:hypothetical protein